MRYKRTIAFILMICLSIGLLGGCKKAEGNKKQSDVAMGRFAEKDVTLPDTIESGKEIAFLFNKCPDGTIELFSANIKTMQVSHYNRKSDGTWEKTMPKWLEERINDINDVAYDMEGNCYALFSSRDQEGKGVSVEILKSTDGITAEKVSIKDYESMVDGLSSPYELGAAGETVITQDYRTNNIYQKGDCVAATDSTRCKFTYTKDQVVFTDGSEDRIDFVNLSDGQIARQIPFDHLSDEYVVYANNEDNIYFVTSDGVYRIRKDGDKFEKLMDSNFTSLKQPSLLPENLIINGPEDFYIVYSDGNGTRTLKQYYFDETLPTVPDKTLSIVSLYDCDAINQGIHYFGKEHPDVLVDYQVLMRDTDEEGGLENDMINQLNTELLAGKGADILILDGLSMDSYIKKGVLSDLTTQIKPLLDEKKILPNIIKNATVDNKIYTLPLKLGITYAYGTKEAVEAADSIETLAQYAKDQEIPLFPDDMMSSESLTMLMYKYYSYEFLQGKSIDEARLNDFLAALKTIGEDIHTFPQEGENMMDVDDSFMMSCVFSVPMYDKLSQLGILTLQDMVPSFEPLTVMDHIQGTCRSVNNQYEPSNFVSMNAASQNKELASQFIQMLLSTKVQSEHSGDGYPVNMDALVGYELEDDDFLFSEENFSATQPEDKSKLQAILDLCPTLDTPIITDPTIKNVVVEEAAKYLNGEVSQQEAVDYIINKVNIYLQE